MTPTEDAGQNPMINTVSSNKPQLIDIINRVTNLLTVISAIALSLAVVVILFGINAPLGPVGDNPYSIFTTPVLMISMAFGLAALFRAKRRVF
ncbi:MAG: hypothetical protein R6U89_04890 [Dehalococcoidia bacterium]